MTSSSGLKQLLDSLQLKDGSPDVLARRAELDNLIRNIFHSEIRHLKDQLATFTLHKDICGSLPAELLLSISSYLDLEDLIKIRGVSRQWRQQFSRLEICLSIARRYFRPILSTAYQNSNPERQPGHDPILSDWLPQAASRRVRRLRGLYSSRSARLYNRKLALNNSSYGQYCNGRIAYNRDDRTVAVENIRAGTTTYMVEENRAKMEWWLLTDQFLLVKKVNPLIMLAIPLGDPQESLETNAIRLPSSFNTVSAREDQVAIITTSDEVLIWTIGAGLKSLNTSPFPPHLAGFTSKLARVMFHPQDKHHIFVIFYGAARQSSFRDAVSTQVVIQEYKDDRLVTFHHCDIPLHMRIKDRQPTIKDIEDGSIGILIEYFAYQLDTELASHPEFQNPCFHLSTAHKPSFSHPFMALKFDIYTKRFSTTSYHPDLSIVTPSDRAFYWRDQLLFPTLPHHPSHKRKSFDPNEFELVVGHDACDGSDKPSTAKSLTAIDDCVDSLRGPDEGFVWLCEDHRRGEPGGMCLRGDDDFVVLIGCHGFVVWDFG